MRLDAEVSETRSLAWPLGAAGLSAALIVFVALQPGLSTPAFLAIAAAVTALSFLALTRAAPRVKLGRRRVGVDVRGLTVDGQLVLPRQNIVRARVTEGPRGRCSVVVEGRGLTPSRIVEVDSARIAQALADTLEQPTEDLVELDALPPWAHRMRWLTIALSTSPWILVNLLRHMPGWIGFAVLGLYGLVALPVVLPQKIAIGEDGVLLRWASRRRFIPFALLREARATPLGVELELADDETIEIRLTQRADAEPARRSTMLERIAQGLALHRALEPAEDEALLLRGERDLEAWIHEMTVLGASDAHGYRTIAIPRERLWAVLENASADPSARQGAALALRTRLDDEERERLASVGQKSASPNLRVAIDAVVRAPDVPRLRVALEQADEERGAEARALRTRARDDEARADGS